jgi:hypothetical protein
MVIDGAIYSPQFYTAPIAQTLPNPEEGAK